MLKKINNKKKKTKKTLKLKINKQKKKIWKNKNIYPPPQLPSLIKFYDAMLTPWN